ncbi:hypothetical protein PMI29_04658 [Pseudomonas sp. GM49]|nr:hypothetical protein PMI29_04658 [Pseudomonas sp. GM49]
MAGVSAEFGVIMLLYLKNAWAEREDLGDSTERRLVAAIREGAVQRVRPKAMTVAVIIAGLLPIRSSGAVAADDHGLFSDGRSAERAEGWRPCIVFLSAGGR